MYKIPKRYSVFIQTDKAVYKPSDTVKYRIIVLNSETRPFWYKKLNVVFIDSLGGVIRNNTWSISENSPNKIPSKQEENYKSANDEEEETLDDDIANSAEEITKTESATTEKAETSEEASAINKTNVHVDEFKIAEDTLLGVWEIRVRVNDDENVITRQSFKVQEYVLPRFEIFLNTKPHVTEDEERIIIDVSAKYTFGEKVKGRAFVTATVYDIKYPENVLRVFERTIPSIETSASTAFELKRDLGISLTLRPMIVYFTVAFTETLTNQTLEKKTSVRVYKFDDYTLELQVAKPQFKPDSKYKVWAVVKKSGETIVTSSKIPIELRVKFHMAPIICSLKNESNDRPTRFEYTLEKIPVNGIVSFLLHVPANATDIELKAKFLYTRAELNIKRFTSETRKYLFLTLKSR